MSARFSTISTTRRSSSIGAGKMGELTLRHLRSLQPRQILVQIAASRRPRMWRGVAAVRPMAWDRLERCAGSGGHRPEHDGRAEPIVSRRRFDEVLARRTGGTMVILDIAVPRDFRSAPTRWRGERRACSISTILQRIPRADPQGTPALSRAAEAIVEQEVLRFSAEWNRRRHGPVIARLTQEADAQRRAIVRATPGPA